MSSQVIGGLTITAPLAPRYAEVLTPEACAFVAELAAKFGARREQLLARRVERQREIDAGKLPDFLPETAHIRGGDWRVPPPPPDTLTAARKSPAPSIARWRSMRSTPARSAGWRTLRTPIRRRGKT